MNVTAAAKDKIIEIFTDEELNGMGLRIGILGGGCSGFQYNFTFDVPREDDMISEIGEYKMMIDPMSMMYLEEATLDYKDDKLNGSAFIVKNPNAKTTCGCGSSFGA